MNLLFIMHREQSKDWTLSQKMPTVAFFMGIQCLVLCTYFGLILNVFFYGFFLPSSLSGTTQVSSKYSCGSLSKEKPEIEKKKREKKYKSR